MIKKKGVLPLVYNMIIGLVILGAGTIFVTSDIGQPLFNAIQNFIVPELTQGCDTDSTNSIIALAYALNCTGMHHAGIDVTDICPPQKLFGTKVAACYGEDEDYNCEVQGFELTKDPEYEDPESWIVGMGDPNCLVYYEAFPEDQAADWKVRIEDLSIVGLFIGGTINVLTGGLGAALKVPGAVTKAAIKRTVSTMIERKVIWAAFKKSVSKAALRESKEVLIKKFMQTSKVTSNMVRYVVRMGGHSLGESGINGLNKYITENVFEYVIRQSNVGSKQIQKEMIEKLENKYGAALSKNQKELISKEVDSYVILIKSKKAGFNQLKELQTMRQLNIYGDLMLNSGDKWTKTAMKKQIKKSAKILKNLPKGQKEKILENSKLIASAYMSPKILKSNTFQLWTIDMADDVLTTTDLGPEYSEELNALSTCPIMAGSAGGIGGKVLGTLTCSFVVSAGIMAAYIDNDNEKYNPVGINSLGYKRNYYDIEIEKLADVVNYYYVVLNRNLIQSKKRFFLASPCKTEKVVVKHETMGCYYEECKDTYLCCGKKTTDVSGNWVPGWYEWTLDNKCVTALEGWGGTMAHNTGEMIKRGVLLGAAVGTGAVIGPIGLIGAGVAVAYVDQVNVIDPVTGEFSPSLNMFGHELQILGDWEKRREPGSWDDEVDVSNCINAGIDVSITEGLCKGAYFKGDEYFGLNYPIIKTVENGFVNTYPEKYPGWESKIEIQTPVNYYYYASSGPLVDEVSSSDYTIQFDTIKAYDLDPSTDLTPSNLMMDATGNGIKQCTQARDKAFAVLNPWIEDSKQETNILSVSVEFDESFEGSNYCYSGISWAATIEKGVAMLITVGIDIVFAVPSAGTAAPFIMFATGAAYEIASHSIDKTNAWPKRGW